jgi:hypothetical protein
MVKSHQNPISRGGKCPNFSHHPNIGDMSSPDIWKWCSKIPKMGHLPSPDQGDQAAVEFAWTSGGNNNQNPMVSDDIPYHLIAIRGYISISDIPMVRWISQNVPYQRTLQRILQKEHTPSGTRLLMFFSWDARCQLPGVQHVQPNMVFNQEKIENMNRISGGPTNSRNLTLL